MPTILQVYSKSTGCLGQAWEEQVSKRILRWAERLGSFWECKDRKELEEGYEEKESKSCPCPMVWFYTDKFSRKGRRMTKMLTSTLNLWRTLLTAVNGHSRSGFLYFGRITHAMSIRVNHASSSLITTTHYRWLRLVLGQGLWYDFICSNRIRYSLQVMTIGEGVELDNQPSQRAKNRWRDHEV